MSRPHPIDGETRFTPDVLPRQVLGLLKPSGLEQLRARLGVHVERTDDFSKELLASLNKAASKVEALWTLWARLPQHGDA